MAVSVSTIMITTDGPLFKVTVIEGFLLGVRLFGDIILYFVELSSVSSDRDIMRFIFLAGSYRSVVFGMVPAVFMVDGVVGS